MSFTSNKLSGQLSLNVNPIKTTSIDTTTKTIYGVTNFRVIFKNNDTVRLKVHKGDTSYKKYLIENASFRFMVSFSEK